MKNNHWSKPVCIRLDEKNHEIREKSIKLNTIYGAIYAPKSRCKIEGDILEVPAWVFAKGGLNPIYIVSGLIG